MRNHELTFRPLQGGVLIINPANQRPGTLGAIVTRNGIDRLALSCYHVLCRPNGDPFPDGELVWQSVEGRNGSPIGSIFSADCSAGLDCAAARIDPMVAATGRILGLGALNPPHAPQAGMAVLKSGYVTGVTEGTILQVQGTRVEIQHRPGYPSTYEASDFGDSGAVWVERSTGCPVALHTSSTSTGHAVATDIISVLNALGLSLVIDG
jgi:hypothetical protein